MVWILVAIGVVAAVLGILALVTYLLRIQREEAERQEMRRQAAEDSRKYAEKMAAKEAEKKAYEQALLDATLYGEPGESVPDAAKRLGVVIRTESDTTYYCRYGHDAFLAEKSEVESTGKPVFRKVDPKKFYPPPEREGYPTADYYGWKVIEEYTEEKQYHQQLYDGDDVAYMKVAIDQHGRLMTIGDRGGAEWRYVHDPQTGEYVPGWEEMLRDK